MQKRIYCNMLLLTFISIMLVSIFLVFIFYTNFSKQVKSELKNKAVFLETILNETTDHINYLKKLNLPGKEIRISLIDQGGTVIYDNEFDTSKLENHKDREEIKESLKTGTGNSKRYSKTLGEETYYYSQRLSDGMVLRIAKTTSSIYGVFMNSLHISIFIILFIFIISHFLAKSLTNKITKPINEIDFDTKSAVYDEISPLIRTITHQKRQIESHLEELEKHAQTIDTIIENMQEGIILLDKNAVVLSANKSAKGIFEIQSTEGKNILEITRDTSINQCVKSALSGKRSNITAEFGSKSYAIFFSPVYESGAIILLLDITEKANAEKLRREFSANVSHELKTPLTSISGYAEMIENKMVKADDIPGFAGKIHEEASRLLALIDDIIMLSELDETAHSKEFEKLNLSKITSEVIASLQDKANESGIKMESDLEPIELNANGQMIFELLYNLIDNGIKYNKPGGIVKISVKQENKSKVKITVSDTGIGISKEHLGRIFERFYRVDKSHSKKNDGTGLGLSIVKHIIAYHKGTIELESKVGKGTTIHVIL